MTDARKRPGVGWRGQLDAFGRVTRLMRDAVTVGASNAYLSVCAAVALALNARALGAGDFGMFVVIQAYVALVGTIATLESWQVVVRIGSRYPRLLPTVVGWGVALDASVCLIATVVAVGVAVILGDLVGISQDGQTLAAIYSLSLITGVTGTPKGLLRLKRRFDILAWMQIARGTAVVAVAGMLFAAGAGLVWYVALYATIAAVTNLANLAFVPRFVPGLWRIRRPRSRRSRAIVKSFVRMAIGTSILATLKNARRNLLVLIAGAVLSPAGVGLFALAARLANIVFKVSVALNQVIFPEVFRLASAGGLTVARFVRVTGLVAPVALVAASVAFMLREPIVVLVGGEDFRGAANTFAFLFATECLFLAGLHFDPIVQRLSGTRPLILAWLASSVPSFALAAVGGTLYGPSGIAMVAFFANLVLYAILFATTLRFVRTLPTLSRRTRRGSGREDTTASSVGGCSG